MTETLEEAIERMKPFKSDNPAQEAWRLGVLDGLETAIKIVKRERENKGKQP